MCEIDWNERAQQWYLDDETTLDKCLQRDDTILFAVRRLGFVLTISGEWIYEPRPSSRTDEFLADTRFHSKEQAFEVWQKRKEL